MTAPLTASIDLLTVALGGDHEQLAHDLHLLATEALDDANSAEEAADALADVMETLSVLAAETARALAGGVVAALGSAPPETAVAIELGTTPVIATAGSEATQLAVALLRSAAR